MKLGIVTDSTSDLPAYLVEQYQIEVIPTILILDGREYADGVGISRDDFYKQLPTFRTPPTTAAPSIGEFAARYESLFARGCDHIFSIHAAGHWPLELARQHRPELAGPLDGHPVRGTGMRRLASV